VYAEAVISSSDIYLVKCIDSSQLELNSDCKMHSLIYTTSLPKMIVHPYSLNYTAQRVLALLLC
jgi:hypothetical protein